jgi:hypothetical protein
MIYIVMLNYFINRHPGLLRNSKGTAIWNIHLNSGRYMNVCRYCYDWLNDDPTRIDYTYWEPL